MPKGKKKDRQLVKFPAKFPSNATTKIIKSIYIFKDSLKMLFCLFQVEALNTITALGDYQSTSAHN
jgi:hypothetical protein